MKLFECCIASPLSYAPVDNPLIPAVNTSAASLTSDRFQDTANVDKSLHSDERIRRSRSLNLNRSRLREAIAREQDLKARNRADSLSEARRLVDHQTSGLKARRNSGGTAYNILNMQYLPTPEGNKLRQYDQMVHYKNDVRAYFLATKSHVGFSPITGSDHLELKYPELTSD